MRPVITLYLILSLILVGCASSGIGSQKWYDQRMQEIETAHTNKKISEAEYFSLKNDTDRIRFSYRHTDSCYPTSGFYFHDYWFH